VQRRLCAASGLAFLACTTLGLLLANVFATTFYPSPFGAPFGPQTDVLAYFTANRAQVRAMSFVFALAALALLVFVAYSVETLIDTTHTRRLGLPGLALGAGVLAAGFWLLTALLLWALSLPETSGASSLLRTLHNLVYVAGGPTHVVTLGVFLGAIAAAQRSASLLPPWITWLGALAALLSIVAVFALLWEPASVLLPLGRGLSLLWIFVESVALLVTSPRETPVGANQQGGTSAEQRSRNAIIPTD
jgi:hypothetical protein